MLLLRRYATSTAVHPVARPSRRFRKEDIHPNARSLFPLRQQILAELERRRKCLESDGPRKPQGAGVAGTDRDSGRSLIREVANSASLGDVEQAERRLAEAKGSGAFAIGAHRAAALAVIRAHGREGQELYERFVRREWLGRPEDDPAGLNALIVAQLRAGHVRQAFKSYKAAVEASINVSPMSVRALIDAAGNRTATGVDPLKLLNKLEDTSPRIPVSVYNSVLSSIRPLDDQRVLVRSVLSKLKTACCRPNGDTIDALLLHATTLNDVREVEDFLFDKANAVRMRPGHAVKFTKAYLQVQDDVRVQVAECIRVIDRFFGTNVGIRGQAIEEAIEICCQRGYPEAAMRLWGEMRRAWLGYPSGKALRLFALSLATSERPQRVKFLWRQATRSTQKAPRDYRTILTAAGIAGFPRFVNERLYHALRMCSSTAARDRMKIAVVRGLVYHGSFGYARKVLKMKPRSASSSPAFALLSPTKHREPAALEVFVSLLCLDKSSSLTETVVEDKILRWLEYQRQVEPKGLHPVSSMALRRANLDRHSAAYIPKNENDQRDYEKEVVRVSLRTALHALEQTRNASWRELLRKI